MCLCVCSALRVCLLLLWPFSWRCNRQQNSFELNILFEFRKSERRRVRERSALANSPQRERQGKHESAIMPSTDCVRVCECGFWFETEKRGKFYKRATFCYVFASVVWLSVCVRERVCVCVCVCVVASFWLWRAELRQQRIAVSVATFSFVSPMPIIIERTLVCLPVSPSVCLFDCLSSSLSL